MADTIKRAAVIGFPVGHSLSPVLHRYWLGQYGIRGDYEAIAIDPEQLPAFMQKLREGYYCGVNVTIPHKQSVIPYLDALDDTALSAGAVNVITIRDGKLYGMNTDVYGFAENLKQAKGGLLKKRHALILGSGGAARAVCKALALEGFFRITICSRNQEKAQDVAAIAPEKTHVIPWDNREIPLADTQLLVNSTPLGMAGKPSLEIDIRALPQDAIVCDIVYNPLMTDLLTRADKAGYATIDGLGMLIQQAIPCFEAWFGVRPEANAAVRKHVQGHLS